MVLLLFQKLKYLMLSLWRVKGSKHVENARPNVFGTSKPSHCKRGPPLPEGSMASPTHHHMQCSSTLLGSFFLFQKRPSTYSVGPSHWGQSVLHNFPGSSNVWFVFESDLFNLHQVPSCTIPRKTSRVLCRVCEKPERHMSKHFQMA